jgi:hypothetical protein
VINPDSYAAWRLDGFFDQLPIAEVEASKLTAGEDLPAVPTLVKADDGSPEVWVVDGEYRRHVPGPAVMTGWRFDWATIQSKPAAEVNALEVGPPWRARPVLLSGEGAIWLVDDPFPRPDAGDGGESVLPSGEDGGPDATGTPGDDIVPEAGASWTETREGDAGSCAMASTPPVSLGGFGWLLLAAVCSVWACGRLRQPHRSPICTGTLGGELVNREPGAGNGMEKLAC